MQSIILQSQKYCVFARVNAKIDLAIPKGAAAARQGKSKYRHAVRQTEEQREEKDEVEEAEGSKNKADKWTELGLHQLENA